MKRIIFFVALVCMAMFGACDGKRNEYKITGVVPDWVEEGEVVYMTDYHEGVVVNSAVVSRKKFVFKGETENAKAIMLSIQDMQADLILCKGNLIVDMSDPYSTKGNILTEKLYAFFSNYRDAIQQTSERIAEIDESLSDVVKDQIQEAIYDDLLLQLDEIPKLYLRDNPNDALGAMIFYIWMQNQMEPSSEIFQNASRLVGGNVLNFGPVKQMSAYFDKISETAVGKPFIDFKIANGNKDGTSVSLSDYVGKGKYVLVDFWASWCIPCRIEAPVLAEVYNNYKGDRFEMVSVAVMDKREDSLYALEEDGNDWPQILDAQTIPAELYGIQAIPHIILFDPDGVILARNLRGDNLKDKIAEVMQSE